MAMKINSGYSFAARECNLLKRKTFLENKKWTPGR
jgi:hypothetical protein